MFVRDMLRLSVDIDLTYIPIEESETLLSNILSGRKEIKDNIQKLIR